MFVSDGAKGTIRKKRKDHFFDDYIKGMLVEAESLGISREEIIDMIASGKGEESYE